MDPKRKRLVLTSLNQVINLVQKNEKLQKLPKFAKIKAIPQQQIGVKQGCSRCGNKSGAVQSKKTVEDVLTSLSTVDFLEIKRILELDELCYWNRNKTKDKLELVCV